ncbi:MAG: hypothetical protein JO100_17895 [Pseudonocardia sp.]|nr:hypothetical protein [Pseudonocardia sp.]
MRRLLGIAEDAAVEATAIRRLNRWGHAQHQRNRISRERTAQSIAVYQCEVIPGLLQTDDYCRELLLSIGAVTPDDFAESVRARHERQEAIRAAGVQFEAVITETALAWQPAAASVSDAQLKRLLKLLDSPTHQIGIVTLDAMRHAKTCNAFQLLRWPDGTREVDTEALTTESTLTEPVDVDAYEAMFAHQREQAVYGADAAAVIERVRDRLD